MNPSEQELLDMINEVRQMVRGKAGRGESTIGFYWKFYFNSNSNKNQG